MISSANMKKESKAYSYEDQKWEVELRQEMMKKREEEKEEGAGHTHKMDVRELLKKTKLSQKHKVGGGAGHRVGGRGMFYCHLSLSLTASYGDPVS